MDRMQVRDPGPARQLNPWLMASLVGGLVLFCYWPALQGTLLWDDPAHVPRPEMRSWTGLARIWTDVHATQQYYPVLFSAFWFEHLLWGDHTLGYHLANVVWHTTSCCLLALVLRRLWANPAIQPAAGPAETRMVPAGAEWLAAGLFAVHPVFVESVAWITEQKNTLSLVFYLLAGLAYLRFAVDRRLPWYGLATALFLLALGAKTATVTLPAALLVVSWWQNGRLSWRRDAGPLIPWFLAAGAMGLFTSWVERKVIGAEGADFEMAALDRVLLAGRNLWFYLGKMVWPVDLNFFYPRWNVATEATGWAGYLWAAVAVTVVLWAIRGRTRGPLAGWLLFVGALVPILGVFQVYFFIFSFVNDHFLYLPGLAFVSTVAAGFALTVARMPTWGRAVGWSLAGVVIISLAGLAHRQSRLYVDNETLFRSTIAKNPQSWMGHHILGFALSFSPDRRPEAMAEFREALRLNPRYPDAHLALAVELARRPGPKSEAIAEYERALELRPNYPEAHNNLAFELAKLPDRTVEVLAHYEIALRVKPNFAEAHANLADVLAKLPGRAPEALAHYESALRINPQLAWVHCHLAFLLAQVPGREPEALDHYETALRIRPDYLEAHNGLAILSVQLGQLDRARAEWEKTLQLDPGYETARRNLRLLEQMTRR